MQYFPSLESELKLEVGPLKLNPHPNKKSTDWIHDDLNYDYYFKAFAVITTTGVRLMMLHSFFQFIYPRIYIHT